MTLDVTTPKGLETLEQERVELSILKSRYPLLTFAHTPKDRESAVDGAIIEGDQWVGLFLSSCRNLTRNQLKGFGNDVILTYKKMHKAVDLAERLCIPVFGYFFLIPERLVMVVKVINDRGEIMPKVRIEMTETQATVNGGKAVRSNAYIDAKYALEIKG